MDFTNMSTDSIIKHLETLQNTTIQAVKDFPHTGNYEADVREMKDYVYEYENELKNRGVNYIVIDERLGN